MRRDHQPSEGTHEPRRARRRPSAVARALRRVHIRMTMIATWVAVPLFSQRPQIRVPHTRKALTASVFILVLFVVVGVLDRRGLLPHTPEAMCSMIFAAFVAGFVLQRIGV
jgi:hypothetical protein